MPAISAERMCPQAVFIPPGFARYRAVSAAVRKIFKVHTDLVESLSLDEAYLDVTESKTGLTTATRVAIAIRKQIRDELKSDGTASREIRVRAVSDLRSMELDSLHQQFGRYGDQWCR
jgi:DNA polymerase IV